MTSDKVLEAQMDEKRQIPRTVIERIIKPYNAQIVKEDGNTFLIQYPKLGQGSCIASDLEHEFAELRVKLEPSDLLLEVEIL